MAARKHFFFEKKKQKTFIGCRGLAISARQKNQKFFGSFFQKRTFFLLVLLCAPAADAQESTEDRMRDALRQSVMEMRAAQDQAAQAQADLQKAQAEKAALQAQLDAANAKLAGATAKPAELAAARARLQAMQEAGTALQRQNAQLQASLQASAAAIQSKDAQGSRLQAGLKSNTAALQACISSNTKLIDVSQQILHLYETQGFRSLLLKSYEPVLGLWKVKLENLVQDYDDKIHDQVYVEPKK
jgi:hypothetical protein